MNKRYSGRKIKRSKMKLYKRRKGASALSVIVTVLVLSALIFVGYSAAGPIMSYINGEHKVSDPAVTDETDPITVAPSSEETTTAATEEVHVTTVGEPVSEGFSAYCLDGDSLSAESTLRAELENARSLGYTAVLIDMKLSGGALCYSSEISLLQGTDICIYELSASEIADIVKQYHMTPVARINTLTDHLIPKVDSYMGYRFEDERIAWYDNKVEKGGKPWLSPFAEKSVNYLSDIAAEISNAGFGQIVISDLEFFDFRPIDLNYIGSIVKDPDRYKALLAVADSMQTAAGKELLLELSATEIINGECEAFHPEEEPELIYAVRYSPSELGGTVVINGNEIVISELGSAEAASAVFDGIKALCGDRELIPIIVSDGLSDSAVRDIISALVADGYSSYILE